MTSPITRNDVEEFLYREAAMLDRWQLEEWLALFTDDAIYHVPTIGTAAEIGPENTLFYIADDRIRLRERVIRLQKKGAHAEWPRSRTRHMVTNVLIDERAGHRFKNAAADVNGGSYRYRLVIVDGGLRIREKRSMLDMDALRPHGRVSILL
jgi:p-cumate 2,3-dioxygenase beta subunit